MCLILFRLLCKTPNMNFCCDPCSLFSLNPLFFVLFHFKEFQLLSSSPACHLSLFATCIAFKSFFLDDFKQPNPYALSLMFTEANSLLPLAVFPLSLTLRYIPPDKREENDQSTHKWMVYVRGSRREPSIDHFVKKVWFFLHPSYKPNDLVEVRFVPICFSAYFRDRQCVCV